MRTLNNPSLPRDSKNEKGKQQNPEKAARKAQKALTPAQAVFRKKLINNAPEQERTIPDIFKLYIDRDSGFFFGMEKGMVAQDIYIGKPAGVDGHILGVGESGRGKTQGMVIPTLRTWEGFQVVLDVKGDLANYWKKLNRFSGKKLKVFHPGSSASLKYDPFSPLRHDGPDDLAGNALDLAKTLIPLKTEVPDPVWVQTAQAFLAGAIIYYFDLGSTFADTMVEILTQSVTGIIEEIMQSDNTEAKIFMSKLSNVQDKIISNIGMELSSLAVFVTDSAIRDVLHVEENDPGQVLDWAAFNTETRPFDVIMCIPEDNLERWEAMIRLIVNQLIRSLERRPLRTYNVWELPPVLLMLDEFPRLGKVPAIRNGLITLRGRGVTISLFVQSIASLEEIYGKATARVIVENCSFKAILGSTNVESQQYFATLCGTRKVVSSGYSASYDPSTGHITSYGGQVSETREPIIYPHEFQTIEDVALFTPSGNFRIGKTLFADNEQMFMRPDYDYLNTPLYEFP